MLVNIQSDSDFACHALNRDVWKDEMVESLVQSGFIFWQQSEKSDEAKVRQREERLERSDCSIPSFSLEAKNLYLVASLLARPHL